MSLGLGLFVNFFKRQSSLDPDASAYIAAVEAADGQALESGVRLAINNFVVGTKEDSTWTSITDFCFLAGPRTLAGILVPLKGTAPTSFNFVSGDYDRKLGLTGNATTKYLNTNKASNNFAQGNFHYGVGTSASGATTLGNRLIGNAAATTGPSNIFSDGSGWQGRNQSATNSTVLGFPTGVHLVSRAVAANFSYRRGGVNNLVSAIADSPGANNIGVFCGIVGANTPSGFSSAQIWFYTLGLAIDMAVYQTRLDNYKTDIAGAIP